MAGPSQASDGVLKQALIQLGFTPAQKARVPASYLEELKKHIQNYPLDTDFKVTLQPGKGFGVVTCLEQGCGIGIKLSSRATSADGGKREGFGSFSAYKDHIIKHPTHVSMRTKRVKDARSAKALVQFKADPDPAVNPKSEYHSDEDALAPRMSKRKAETPYPPLTPQRARPPKTMKAEPIPYKTPLRPVDKNQGDMFVDQKPFDADDPFVQVPGAYAPATQQLQPYYAPMPAPAPQMVQVQNSQVIAQQQAFDAQNKWQRTLDSMDAVSSMIKSYKRKQHLTPIEAEELARYQREYAAYDRARLELDGYLRQLPPPPPPIAYPPQPQYQAHNFDMDVDRTSSESDDDEQDYSGAFPMLDAPPPVQVGATRGFTSAADLQAFLTAVGNSELFDENATVQDALQKLGLPNIHVPLPGLAPDIRLMPHQAIGVAWMLSQEQGPIKGGCLADDMGLGKTVQTIAAVVSNPPKGLNRMTLIVAPLSLLDQWKLEIELKTGNGLRVFVYYGPSKARLRKVDLQKYDVILTSYGTVMHEWPIPDEEKMAKEARRRRRQGDVFIVEDIPDKRKKKKQEPGLLFCVTWYRIILDEAHHIRTRRTRISRAVSHLEAENRWCLTGTPIINYLSDAYGLLRFLKVRPWNEWDHFNAQISRLESRNADLATTRLQKVFKTMLLRRKKDTQLDGEPLIQLPEKEVVRIILEFTKDERDIYKMVETKSQQVFNKMMRAGTVLKNYHQVLVMLLRLRQLCGHTSLITTDDNVIIDDDLSKFKDNSRQEIIRARTLMSREFVDKVREDMKRIALQRIASEQQSTDATVDETCPICNDLLEDAVIASCYHTFCRGCINDRILGGSADAGSPMAEIALKVGIAPRPTCPVCTAPVQSELLFTREAFELDDDNLDEEDDGEEQALAKLVIRDDDDDDDNDVQDVSSMIDVEVDEVKPVRKGKSVRKQPRRSSGRRVQRILDSDEEDEADEAADSDLDDFIVQSDEDEDEKDRKKAEKKKQKKRLFKRGGSGRSHDDAEYIGSDSDVEVNDSLVVGPMKRRKEMVTEGKIRVLSRQLPSTKMMFMMNSLLEWQKEHPDDKVMIISQWTQCLDLVSEYLNTKQMRHVKYQGDMTRQERDIAVRVFMQSDEVMIMLMSLKCGGIGLNLTRANRVISLDLGWSDAVENQAFDRVHRLGQRKAVLVQRPTIKDTIEERIIALQERKRNLADGSLGEGSGKKIGRLSVKELASLFGLDERGNVL